MFLLPPVSLSLFPRLTSLPVGCLGNSHGRPMELRVKPCRRRRPGASSPLVPVFSAPNPAGVCSCIEQGSEEEEPPAPVAILFCSSSSPFDPTRPCVSGIVPASRSPRLRPPPSSSRSASALPRLVRTKPRRPLLDRASAGHLRLELPEIAPAASSPLCVPRCRGSISSRAEDARSSCPLTVCRPRWPIQPLAQLQPLPHRIGPRSASSLEPNASSTDPSISARLHFFPC